MPKPRPGQHAGRLAGQLLAAEHDPTGIGTVECAEQMEQRRFAAPGGAEHRDDLVGPDLERDVVEHTSSGASTADRLADPVRFEDGHCAER